MKNKLPIEKILKEMVDVEDKAKEIILSGEKESDEILLKANNEANKIYDEQIKKAKNIEKELLLNAEKQAIEEKEKAIRAVEQKNINILNDARKRKEKAFHYINRWLKNDI